MGFLFRKSPAVYPEFTGYQTSTSVNTMPIPLIYGCPRISGNIIDIKNFHAVAVKQSSGGGKGLLGGSNGKSGPTQYTYYADAIIALGEAPPIGLGMPLVFFFDQGVFPNGGTPGAFSYATGQTGQGVESYWASNYGAAAHNYPYTAYFMVANLPLDSTATVPQMNFIIQGQLAGTAPLNRAVYSVSNASSPAAYGSTVNLNLDMDADPSLVMYDYLTDLRHGAGFPTSFIDNASFFSTGSATNPAVGDATFQTYCQAVGFGFSAYLSNPEQALNVIGRWCDLMSVAPVWTGTTLKFIPYYDSPVGYNTGYDSTNEAGIAKKYFYPNVQPIFSLNDDDFVQTTDNQPPVTYSRIDTADVYNTVRLDFKDRYNLWNDNVIEAKDENDIELNGIRVDNLGSAQEFSHVNYATLSAYLKVNRNAAVRVKYTFKLSWEYCVLDPMDVVWISDAALGLVNFPVRILTIEEDDNLELTITAEEFPAGAQQVLLYTSQASNNTPFNTNTTAANVNPPVILEPPQQLLSYFGQSLATIVLGICAGPSKTFDPNFGGCEVFASLDNVNYSYQGTFQGRSTMGYLMAPMAAFSGTNPDNATGLVTTAAVGTGVNTLTFASVPGSVVNGQYVTDITQGDFSSIAPGTVVSGTSPTTVTISPATTGPVSLGDTIAFGDVLSVDLTESHGALSTATSLQASNFQTLGAIWDASGTVEYIGFVNADLSAPFKYNCLGLYRGLFGTAAIAHSVGAQFLYLANESFFQENLPNQFVGQTIYFKLPVFNIFNQSLEPLSICDTYVYTPSGTGSGGAGSPGYPVYSIRVITSNTNIQL